MSGVEEVKKFIEEHDLDAKILQFDEPVRTVEEAAERSKADPSEIVKTIILIADDRPIAAIIQGNRKIDLEKLRKVLNANYVRLAKPSEVLKLLGIGIGAVSPLLNSMKRIRCIIDEKVLMMKKVLAGGGSEKTLVLIKPKDLAEILKPIIADI
ncbi:MAG: YbaK/EbsC family protein, partial [Thaumarchaeota archaeon]|nr:YbaK/EbsC family protein [Nitrososphaerota archaeon]